MEGIELIAFEIIANVGNAKSFYIEAISEAKNQNFDKAYSLIKEGESSFHEGHKAHAKLIQAEANDEQVSINLLLVHAEDQLMSAETFRILAEEFIDVYKSIQK